MKPPTPNTLQDLIQRELPGILVSVVQDDSGTYVYPEDMDPRRETLYRILQFLDNHPICRETGRQIAIEDGIRVCLKPPMWRTSHD